MKVYLVQNQGYFPNSSYFDTIEVFDSIDKARICLETISLDTRKVIDSNNHKYFKSNNYQIEYDRSVPSDFSRADVQICFYDNDYYYDIYWIEEFEIN